MDLEKIPPRSKDGNVHVLVEIPKGGHNKYEYDKELGVIRLDRALYTSMYYPTEYGFVPGTRGTDGELLDALVMVEQPTFPGCLVEVRLIGVLTIEYGGDQPEQKLLSVPVNEPRFDEYRDIGDVPHHQRIEIEHFFDVFKDLEGKEIRVPGWEDAARANQVLEEAVQAHGREG